MPIMNLLRSKSRNVQFEAFHVFKVGAFTFRSLTRSTPLYRFLLPIQRDPQKSRRYSSETKRNYSGFLTTSSATGEMDNLMYVYTLCFLL